jgi:5-methylcytosine-specific restriction endonuclease McrA
MTRRSMSPSRRKRILERDGHACTACTDKEGPFEIDHHLPIWLGGDDTDDNLRTLCRNCHKVETKVSCKARAKCKRLNGQTRQNRRKRKIPGRPFPEFKRKLPSRTFKEARM